MFEFKTPIVLILIPIVSGILLWSRTRARVPSFRFPSGGLVKGLPMTFRARFNELPFYLRLIAIVLFISALAGPRMVLEESFHNAEVIDIVLALDASGSMAAEDFTIGNRRYNRLEVVVNVVKDFIEARHADRIGLIAFAAQAYTVCPLTTDYSWLLANLERVKLGLIEDGTAVGSAISSSLARLRNSEAKSKIVILLTDGVNNAGEIDPIQAAQIAKTLGIKIYTIGAGTRGLAPYPVTDVWGRTQYRQVRIEIDEDVLRKIADITGGQYYRATDTESLKRIYAEIDQLEKTEIKETGYKEYSQLFGWFLLAGLGLLLVEMILINTVFLRIP